MDKDKQKIIDQILLWTEEEVAEMLKQYNKKHTDVFKKEVAKLYATEIEKKLIENGIVCCCKYCGSINFTRRGKDIVLNYKDFKKLPHQNMPTIHSFHNKNRALNLSSRPYVIAI